MPLDSIVLAQGRDAWTIYISKTVTFFLPIQYRDSQNRIIPLTGFTAKMEIRRTVDADEPPILTVETGDGIAIDEAAGLVIITLSAEKTADLPELSGDNQGRWDVLIYGPDGTVSKLLYGPVTILGTVTRE